MKMERGRSKWEYLLFRILYMILFWLLSRLAWVVVGICAVVQLGFLVVRNQRQADLLGFSVSLVTFARQCGDYLVARTDDKPFPFSDWPRSE